mgnify:CR=1 FL=1
MERGGRSCNLCLTEKTMIAGCKSDSYLNKINEVMTRCLHRFPHLLNNWYTSLPLIPPAEPGGQHLGEPEHEEDQPYQCLQAPSPSPPPHTAPWGEDTKKVTWEWFHCNKTATPVCIHKKIRCDMHPHPDCMYKDNTNGKHLEKLMDKFMEKRMEKIPTLLKRSTTF